MTWRSFMPPANPKAPIVVCATAADGRKRSRLTIVFRPASMSAPVPWLQVGKSVTVQIGEGDHLGKLRIGPAGGRGGLQPSWQLRGRTGQGKAVGAVVRLLLLDFPGVPAGGLARQEAPFELEGHSLVVSLPLCGAEDVSRSDSKQPYKGIVARTGLNGTAGRPSRVAL